MTAQRAGQGLRLRGERFQEFLDPRPRVTIGLVLRQNLRQAQQLEFGGRIAEQGKEVRVGIAAATIQNQQRALRRGFDKRAIALGRRMHVFDGPDVLAVDLPTVAHHMDEQQGHERRDDARRVNETALQSRDLVLDVFGIKPRADHPSPRGEAPNIRFLGFQATRVVRPLPDIIDVPLVMAADQIGELDENSCAEGIAVIGKVVPVEIRAVWVHDHAGIHVLQPEIILVLVTVAQGGDPLGGFRLRLLPRDAPGRDLALGSR